MSVSHQVRFSLWALPLTHDVSEGEENPGGKVYKTCRQASSYVASNSNLLVLYLFNFKSHGMRPLFWTTHINFVHAQRTPC